MDTAQSIFRRRTASRTAGFQPAHCQGCIKPWRGPRAVLGSQQPPTRKEASPCCRASLSRCRSGAKDVHLGPLLAMLDWTRDGQSQAPSQPVTRRSFLKCCGATLGTLAAGAVYSAPSSESPRPREEGLAPDRPPGEAGGRTFHIMPHSHSDVEWYWTFATTREWTTDILDKAMIWNSHRDRGFTSGRMHGQGGRFKYQGQWARPKLPDKTASFGQNLMGH